MSTFYDYDNDNDYEHDNDKAPNELSTLKNLMERRSEVTLNTVYPHKLKNRGDWKPLNDYTWTMLHYVLGVAQE